MLGEPTNDLDTDMLAALEELLDSWPGTLLVVSHDRYFLERVTDQQYAILDGRFRHLPAGVDEYLRLRETQRAAASASAPAARSQQPSASSSLAGAERRSAQKELASIDRRLERLQGDLDTIDVQLADAHDDYAALLALQERRDAASAEIARLEDRWLELGEALDH